MNGESDVPLESQCLCWNHCSTNKIYGLRKFLIILLQFPQLQTELKIVPTFHGHCGYKYICTWNKLRTQLGSQVCFEYSVKYAILWRLF